MRQRVIHVLTHDSIGLGEDGPTHQPVEHLASPARDAERARVPPGGCDGDRRVLGAGAAPRRRPEPAGADRQALPALRDGRGGEPLARGGYVLAEADGPRRATLIATGSEVAIAMDARAKLAGGGDRASPSCRCRAGNCSPHRTPAYRAAVLGGASAHRHRGRRRLRLGALAGAGRGVHRHDRLRRLGPVRGSVQANSGSRPKRRWPRCAKRLG